MTETFVNALVKQDPHLMNREKTFARFGHSTQSRFLAHRGETFQESLQRVAGFKVVEQSAHQHPRSPEHRFPGHDFWIADYDRLHVLSLPPIEPAKE